MPLVFVRGVDWDKTKEVELCQFFIHEFGDVSSVDLKGQPSGCCVVDFVSEDAAKIATAKIDCTMYTHMQDSMVLKLRPYRPKNRAPNDAATCKSANRRM